ncbi:MAG TPA: tetratricopeptide repeat protein, partial [Vicinamibacteria bacterium]
HRAKLLLAASGLLAFAFTALLAFRSFTPGGPTEVALVPFVPEPKAPDGDILSAFTADGLAAGLQAVPGIRLSLVEPELREKPDAEILRALGARWLLRGRIAAEGGNLSLRSELVRADGTVVLRDTVEGPDPIDTLDRVRARALQKLGAREDAPRIAHLRTSSFDAYRMYLEARTHHDGWFAEGDLEKARSLYKSALELDPLFTAALAGQALASTSRYLSSHEPGDLAVARYASERAAAQGGDLPEAHLAKATLSAVEEKWDEARASFARAFELAPGDDGARRNAADLYETLGRDDEAEEIYEKLLEEQPLHWNNHYFYGGYLYRKGDLKAAAPALARAKELSPESPEPATLLGFCHLASGDLALARREFERALQLAPGPRSRKRLGLVHYYAGEFDQALAQWSEVLSAEPSKPTAHMEVADALRQLGRARDAEAHYRKALALYAKAIEDAAPDELDELEAQRAQVLAALGRCGESKAAIAPILDRNPANPDFLYYGAVAAGRCGLTDWGADLVLQSIGAGNVVGIWFDPDLAGVRLDPRVRRPLELIGMPQRRTASN